MSEPKPKDDKSPGTSPCGSSKRRVHGDRRSRSPPPGVNREDVRHRLRDGPSSNTALDEAHWLHRQGNPAENDGSAQSLPVSSPRRSPRSRLAWTSYVNEGADLVMPRLTPDARLQSPRRDRSRNNSDGDNDNTVGRTSRRPPSLERQEAFLAPGTSTRATRQRGSDGSRAVNVNDNTDNIDGFEAIEAEEVDELYEIGLLYDDEHLRGAAFGFDALASRGGDPTYQYTLDVRRRGARRTRGPRRLKAPPALERPLYGGGFPIRIRAGRDSASAPEDDGIDNYDIAPDADELVFDHDGLADDLGFVEVPDPSGYPDLVYDSDLSDEDDGKSSSGWVVMRDASERPPAVRTQ